MKEQILGTWDVELITERGAKHKGKLTVTKSRLIFDYGVGFPKQMSDDVNHLVRIGDDEYLILNKPSINTIIIARGIFERKITLRLKNSMEYVFECSMGSMDAVSQAISLI